MIHLPMMMMKMTIILRAFQRKTTKITLMNETKYQGYNGEGQRTRTNSTKEDKN